MVLAAETDTREQFNFIFRDTNSAAAVNSLSMFIHRFSSHRFVGFWARKETHLGTHRLNRDITSPSRRSRRKRDRIPAGSARLVLEMNCTTCGPLRHVVQPFLVPALAMRHAKSTGHVVILNGTADLPPEDEDLEVHTLHFIEARVIDAPEETP